MTRLRMTTISEKPTRAKRRAGAGIGPGMSRIVAPVDRGAILEHQPARAVVKDAGRRESSSGQRPGDLRSCRQGLAFAPAFLLLSVPQEGRVCLQTAFFLPGPMAK
jgi:hypothetical protein